MDLRAIKSRARAALRGHWAEMLALTGLSLATNMTLTGLSVIGWWLAPVLAVKLAHPAAAYLRMEALAMRLRGRPFRPAPETLRRRLPALMGIWAAKDGAPLALTLLGGLARARDPMSLSGQALLAVGVMLRVALGLTYYMTDYLLVDRPALSALQALRQARRRLSGRRLGLLELLLSYGGWALLGILAFGIFYMAVPAAPPAALILAVWALAVPVCTDGGMGCVVFFEALCRRPAKRGHL